MDVHLLTVESWGDRVAVRLVAASSERTEQRIAADEAALQEWASRPAAERADRPPTSLGERISDSVRLRLDDGCGTEFRFFSSSSGGTGTERLCEWIFDPDVAPAAERLTLAVETDEGEHTEVIPYPAE
jgi:hypothetical protein